MVNVHEIGQTIVGSSEISRQFNNFILIRILDKIQVSF